ncbi:MAG: alpha/beta hydrolase fold domain-containing protein, partial [Erysipelotrichales bacterium]|nr:alpha/beta hydrolase fold domain-containing protein [Erysipelotrichales bacterium]
MNKITKGIIIFIIIALLVFLTFYFLLPNIKTEIRNRIINEFTNSEYKEELTRLDLEWQMPSNLEKENIEIDEMDAFWIKNSNASHDQVLLNLHGGAYILSLDSHLTTYERMSSNYANYGNIDVLTIDYKTSPDYPYPYALNDALKGYQYLIDLGYESKDIILAGSSAGGGLALALTLYLKDHDM